MDKQDCRTFGDSDHNHYYHLYWACIGGANGVDRWRKIKCHGKIKYCKPGSYTNMTLNTKKKEKK